VISDLSVDIASAYINPFGKKMIDSFYVTNLDGKKITSQQRQRNIRHKLLAVFGASPGQHPESARPAKPAG